MNRSFIPAVVPPVERAGAAYWFAFRGDRLLVGEQWPEGAPVLVDFNELGLAWVRQQYLGRLGEQPCFAVELAEQEVIPEGMALQGLRQVYELLGEELFGVAGRAVQIVEWDRTHQFCGRCGARTVSMAAERAKQCPECGLVNYPRLSPCIIVLVRRGEEILLARAPRFPAGMYSVLAGFVEPGETLEEAVEREVFEEVGVRVKNITYFSSQPWPFPNSLMIGFMADYAEGEIRPEEAEIEAAGWFRVENLPGLPPRMSIARRLIEAFLGSIKG